MKKFNVIIAIKSTVFLFEMNCENSRKSEDTESTRENYSNGVNCTTTSKVNEIILLQTNVAYIGNDSHKTKIRILMDTGSEKKFIDSNIFRKFN